MSFLFPLYLLGAGALAVPIFLHLRRRPPKEHLEFGSLMFLERSPERLTRRARIEQWLLLILRCLALLLLALAFGRPFFRSTQVPGETDSLTRAVILLDRSASMRRAGLHETAVKATLEAARQFPTGTEVAFATFDEDLHLLAELSSLADLSPGARASAIESLLADENAQPTWLGTDLGLAMTQAATLLLSAEATRPADEREIVLISDFQSGAKLDRLNENPWPEEVKLRCVPLLPSEAGNVSITLAATPPRSNIDEAEVYRVRLTNSADATTSSFTLGWKDHPETYSEVLIAPGRSRIISSPPRPEGAERGTLVVLGDAQPFDNEIYVTPIQPRPLRVRFLGKESDSEKAGSPLFYLRRALQPTPALSPVVNSTESLEGLTPNTAEIVVTPGPWDEATGQTLHHFAEAGGLVLALPDATTSSAAFAALTGRSDWTLSEAEAPQFALLSDLDFSHPILAPFARAQIRDFTKIRFWKHRLLDLGSAPLPETTRLIARFDSGGPALLEHQLGEGAIFIFLSGWRPEESQLALSSKFVPLLYSIFDHAGYSIRSAPTLYVGETKYPAPGFYEEGESGGPKRLISVNLDPSEGHTDPFDPRIEFAALGIPLLDTMSAPPPELNATQKQRAEAEEKEAQQKLWRWLIAAALLLLILETWLAGRRTNHPAQLPSSSLPAES